MDMKTAVVIGAGPAGLSAAAKLVELSNEWRVIVLEATDAIGGLSRTVRHNGCRLDIGGHRFFSKSREVTEFWEKLMPTQGLPAWDDSQIRRSDHLAHGGPDPERENRVMLRRRRISRIYYLRHFFNYPIAISFATLWALGPVRTVRAGLSYLFSSLVKRTEDSLENFYINRFGRTLYSMFFEDYTEKLWGVHPSAISPTWGSQRVKGLSLWKVLANAFLPKHGVRETSLIEEFSYPKFGPGQLWEALADDLMEKGVDIRLNARVDRLLMTGGKISAVVANGREIACDAVFSSMPVKDLVSALPDVPAAVADVASRLPYRDFITVGLKVGRLAIENRSRLKTVNGLIPDTWVYVQDRDVKLGRIQVFNNWSPYMVDDPARHVWIGLEYFCSEGDAFWQADDDVFVAKAVAELRQIGMLSPDTPVLDSVRIRVQKAYPAYFGAYGQFKTIRSYLDAIGNLCCIGRNGQHRYNNMDHSVLCGFEAARTLVSGTDKSAIWRVNTEKDYHEGT